MWETIIQQRTNEDNIKYTAYGVRNGSFCIADLCTSPAEIARFVQILNRYGVSTLNAMDIAEDYLAGGLTEAAQEEYQFTA